MGAIAWGGETRVEVMESRVESAWDISCKMMGGALGNERCAHDGVVKSWKRGSRSIRYPILEIYLTNGQSQDIIRIETQAVFEPA